MPGIAITGLIRSDASRAVRSEPLLWAASTTSVAQEIAAINLFRVRNRFCAARTFGMTSLTKAPCEHIALNSLELEVG